MARYPFLADLAWCVPTDLQDAFPGGLGLVSHVLMGLEAEALSTAMRTLRGQGVLALPMHDGLIVAESVQEAARMALEAAYAMAAGVAPRVVGSR